MRKNDLPELLAPTGSMESLKAALNAGADAVYLGGKQFSARYYAANFNRWELKEAVDYAHLRGVKVYVTLNTLIKDCELEDVAEYLFLLYKIGVDAVLVQDVGVAAMARELFPDLNLHASTQMTIHNLEGVLWALKSGFKRVVLARELSLDEIKNIARRLNKKEIELEIFAHGALCYSYSGQCILSSVIGGRSGNRGMCAQPCRKPYKLLTGRRDRYGRPIETMVAQTKGRYLQSTRDLAIYNHLDQIVKSPIDSIKIEGRMRSPEYVAIVVNIYRKALDSIAQGKWLPSNEEIKNLKLAFNRDFTRGYILGARGKTLMGHDRPDKRGLYIGKVINYEESHKKALIKLKNQLRLQKGDGLVLISPKSDDEYYAADEKYAVVIQKSPSVKEDNIQLKIKKPLKPGAKVYLTREKAIKDKIKEVITTAKRFPSPLPIDLFLTWLNDGTPVIQGRFSGAGNQPLEIQFNAEFQMKKAINHPLKRKQIEAQLRRTGGTPFKIRKMDMDYPGELFTPLGKLNHFRRKFLKKAGNKLLRSYRPKIHDINAAKQRLNKITSQLNLPSKNTAQKRKNSPIIAVYANTLENVKGAVEGGSKHIYFEPLIFNRLDYENKCQHDDENMKNNIERAFELIKEAKLLCDDMDVDLIWKWPHITSRSYLDTASLFLNQIFKIGISKIMVEDIGVAESILSLEPKIQIYGSAGLNIWNHLSIDQFSSIFKNLTLAPELSKDELLRLVSKVRERNLDIDLELIVQGNMEIMVSEDCLPYTSLGFEDLKNVSKSMMTFWGLQDVKKRVFPIMMDVECRTQLLNSVEICLLDHMPTLFDIGLDVLTIDSRGRTGNYARDMAIIYGEAMEYTKKEGRGQEKDLKSLKDEIKKRSMGGITTGNFIRGIKG